MHTDESLMPKNKTTWSSWNYLLSGDVKRPVTLTYNMNILQSLQAKPDFLVTLNSLNEINPSKIIKKIDYAHPLFTVDGINAQKKKARSAATTTHTIAVPTGAMASMKMELTVRSKFVRLLESRYESF